MIATFLLLLFGHTLADYPLQGDFLARAKNRMAPIAGVPFYQALMAHAVIHGGFVFLFTGNAFCAVAETVVHAWIDDAKCKGCISYNLDQALHVACKALWAFLIWQAH